MSLTVLHAHCICSAPPGTCLPPSLPKSSSGHAVAASDRTLAASPGPPPPAPSLRCADLLGFLAEWQLEVGAEGGVRSGALHEDTPEGSDSSTGTVGPRPPTGGSRLPPQGCCPLSVALSPPRGHCPLPVGAPHCPSQGTLSRSVLAPLPSSCL